jgi:hypothetical protein
MPSGDTIEVVRPSVPRPRMASPPPSLLTPPATQTQMPTQVEDRAYSLPPFVPPPGRVPVRFERDALPPTPGPTQQDSQPQASTSRPTASPSRSPSRSLSPQPQPTSASTSRAPFQRSPVSRHNSEPEEEHTVVPVPITIKANEFPHRMTDDQLLPTPGFVLPSLKQVGGGPRHGPPVKPLSSGSSSPREARKSTRTRGNGKGKRREGPSEGDAEEEERSMDDEEEDSDDSEDAYDPQGEAGRKKRRAVKRKERARNGRDGSQEVGVEEDREGTGAVVGVGKKRKRTEKTDMEALDPSLVAAGQQGGDSGTDDGSEGDDEEDDDEETGDNTSNGNKKKTKRGKKARKAKRLRVSIRDDLDEEQLATLQPGQAIGDEIDEETMTMADLASGPGQGRISGKAIKIQQGREEIQRRKEEEQERRIRFRVERETRMRGVGGQAAKQAAAAENEDQNEGAEGEQADGAQAGQAGEEDQEEEDIEDYDMNEKGDGDENMDVDGNNVDPDADAGDLDLEEDDDDQEFIVNQHARGFLQLDENGNMIVNTQLNRQQILNESMNEGNVFEDNDDLKFTNSMSHSKRASVIRWTKPMNNKLMTVSGQPQYRHAQLYCELNLRLCWGSCSRIALATTWSGLRDDRQDHGTHVPRHGAYPRGQPYEDAERQGSRIVDVGFVQGEQAGDR